MAADAIQEISGATDDQREEIRSSIAGSVDDNDINARESEDEQTRMIHMTTIEELNESSSSEQ
jgi:hypothetical protein